MNRDFNRINRWTKALALQYLGDTIRESDEEPHHLIAYLFHDDELLRQTAAASLYKISPLWYEEHTSRLREEVKASIDRVIVPPAFIRNQIYREHLKIDRVSMLSNIGIFKELPGVVITSMEDYVEEFEVESGTLLMIEGDVETSLHVVVEGSLDGFAGEQKVGTVGEQELIGESYITNNDRNEYSYISSEKSVLLKLNKDKFYELSSRNYEVVEGLFTVLNDKSAAPSIA